MSWNAMLPLLVVLSPLVPGMLIFGLGEHRHRMRTFLNLSGVSATLMFMGAMVWGVYQGWKMEARFPLLPDFDLVLHADALSVLFASLSSVLWFLTTLYAIGYLENSPHRSRFFGFFSVCVASTLGIALAGNMITFVLFYELLTLSTYPLVVHRGSYDSMRAGRIYLVYTLFSGAVLLMTVVWLQTLAGPLEFARPGLLDGLVQTHRTELVIAFVLLIASLGVKASLMPLHGWLPVAMVAPAPVSALLHAVAVVKAGAFGIVRVVYDLYGVELARGLGLLLPLAVFASLTIILGSVYALYQDDLKKRLAYSTVSQVSYIALGVAIAGPIATVGGLVHLVHQGLMKITLFFCAGNLSETLHIRRVSEMAGVGRRMPWTMAAFTLGALGMIGVPPMAGFISKWYLGAGGVASGDVWVIWVMVASSALNAAYFLPILYTVWFRPPAGEWRERHHRGKWEAHWMLLIPPLVTAGLALLAGLFAASPVSPLAWARIIAAREYGL